MQMEQPNVQIWMHNLETDCPSFSQPLRLFIQTERSRQGLKTVYSSRPFLANKKAFILNEFVSFELEFPEAFIKFSFWAHNDALSPPTLIGSLCCFLPDLITKTNTLRVTLTQKDKIDIMFTLNTSETRSFNDEAVYAHVPTTDEQSSMLEKMATSRKFVTHLTPLRKGVNIIKRVVLEKKMKRDFLSMTAVLMFLFYGNWCLLLTVCYLVATGKLFALRFWIVEGGMHHFYNYTAAGEIKQNLELIRFQQTQIIQLLTNVKSLIYHRDRTNYFKFMTTQLAIVPIALLVIYNLPKRYILATIVLALFCFKYQLEFRDLLSRFERPLNSLIERIPTFKFHQNNVDLAPIGTEKVCFLYEEQFINVYGGKGGSLSLSYG